MKTLFYIFMFLFWYGLTTGFVGAALISFAWALLVRWACKSMHAQEQAWLNDPDNAKEPPDTHAMLSRAGCECS